MYSVTSDHSPIALDTNLVLYLTLFKYEIIWSLHPKSNEKGEKGGNVIGSWNNCNMWNQNWKYGTKPLCPHPPSPNGGLECQCHIGKLLFTFKEKGRSEGEKKEIYGKGNFNNLLLKEEVIRGKKQRSYRSKEGIANCDSKHFCG